MSCKGCQLVWQSECAQGEFDTPQHTAAASAYQSLLLEGARNPARYARHRLWALMFWRPLYLAICSLLCQSNHIGFSRFRLHWTDDRVVGFSGASYSADSVYPGYPPQGVAGSPGADCRVYRQMHSLVHCCDSLLSSVDELKRVNRRFAMQLVLDALVERVISLGQSADKAIELASVFALATDQILGLALASGHVQQQQYQRQSCCLHYLKPANDLCPGCPRTQ